MRLVVSDRAVDDLNQIFDYLNPLNPAAARNQLAAISDKFGQIARFPFIGRERPAFGSEIRSSVSGSKVIFYRVGEDRIVILRVVDGRMDLDKEFRR